MTALRQVSDMFGVLADSADDASAPAIITISDGEQECGRATNVRMDTRSHEAHRWRG